MKKLLLLGCAVMLASAAVAANEQTAVREVSVTAEEVGTISVDVTKLKACNKKGKNYCYAAEANKCIAVKSFDDIARDKEGMCACVGVVATKKVTDNKNSSTIKDWDKKCERRTSSRTRVYEIPVNFYCPRYFAVSGEADDFVVASSPKGIGTSSKHASWKEAHDNSIKPAVSSSKIKKGTARLEVQDRWLREVGFSGLFYFPVEKTIALKGGAGKLPVKASWKKGHTANKPIGGWIEKDGQAGCGKTTGDVAVAKESK
ncbi:MAG: hypothetical protein II942_02585 [Alphaproteobacteria bacterium]|nr:hypothetical protein [Alphaproteobacteria bacterium]